MLATRWSSEEASLARLGRWAVVALIALGAALSASVAGMAGALVAILVWLSSPSVRAGTRVTIVAALAVALMAAAVVGGGSVTSPTERLQQVTSTPGLEPAAGSGQERLEIARTAWPRISADPLVGAGLDTPDTVVTVLSAGRTVPYQVHGALLAAWYGAGIFGLIGILIVFAAVFAAGWRALRREASDDGRLIGWALCAAFAAFIVYAMTAPLFFQQYGWFAAVMLIAWSVGVEEVSRRRPATAPSWGARTPRIAAAP
jgi:O-antigen ligase